MNIIKYRKVYYTVSSLLVLVSLICIFAFGFKLSIEFTGGSITEVKFEGVRPESLTFLSAIKDGGFDKVDLQPAGDSSYIIRTNELGDEGRVKLLGVVGSFGKYSEERSSSVGPTVGEELRAKAIV